MRNLDLGLGEIFKEIVNLVNAAGRTEEKEVSSRGIIKGLDPEKGLRGAYGISVRLGLGDEITKVASKSAPLKEDLTGETGFDIFDESDLVMIVVDLPGADQNSIRVKINGDTLLFEASGSGRRYFKEIPLPAPVQEETIKTSYQNGVLQISILKAPAAGQS